MVATWRSRGWGPPWQPLRCQLRSGIGREAGSRAQLIEMTRDRGQRRLDALASGHRPVFAMNPHPIQDVRRERLGEDREALGRLAQAFEDAGERRLGVTSLADHRILIVAGEERALLPADALDP